MDQIKLSQLLIKHKSIWDIMYDCVDLFEKIKWEMILSNLVILFRKDSFCNLVCAENYYPNVSDGCRYYLKPNDGSNGKGIIISQSLPSDQLENYTICPEILTPLVETSNGLCKYDYRVWIGISGSLDFFVCPTIIKRISLIPFSLETDYGSLTNTSQYAIQTNYKDPVLYEKIVNITSDILKKLNPDVNKKREFMLTGWDFIENRSNELFVLEVNCNPGVNVQHLDVLNEYLNWLLEYEKDKNI